MDLEAMRRDDGSWHPCRISLSSSNPHVGIIIEFGTGQEDVIYNKEDALSRLRFRSTSLEGDECTRIKGGECVLALQKTQFKSLFFDAIIEEPKRVKHSKRVHCRCSFEIKWLNSELKGETVDVPTKSILKLSDRSIDEHPIFSGFLNALSSENGGEIPPFPSFSEETTSEAEFVGILEKQVEEISKLVDGSKASNMDLFLEVKSANALKKKPSEASMESQISKTSKQGALGRSTRSRSKILLETEVKKESYNKPVLTPLAARAALASLVHELPVKSLRFSEEDDVLKRKDSQKFDTTKSIELPALDATSNSTGSTFYLQNRVLLCPNPRRSPNNSTFIEVRNASIESPYKLNAKEKHKSHDSSDISATQMKEMEPSKESYGGIEDGPIVLQHSKNSVNDRKQKITTSSRRLTRSMQKDSEISTLEMKRGFPVEMLCNPQKPAQLARSTLLNEVLVLRDGDDAPISKSPSFELHREVLVSSDDVKGSALTKKSPGATIGLRCTRSTKQREKDNSSSGILLEKNEPTADTWNVAEDLVTPDNHEIQKKKLISIPMYQLVSDSISELDSTSDRNEPKSKKRTRSFHEDDLGASMKDEENPLAMKMNHASSKKASAKPPLRSSPRLTCLPRPQTRSQAGSSPNC